MARRPAPRTARRQPPPKKRSGLPPMPVPQWAWIWIFAAGWMIVFAVISIGFWRVGGYGVETDALGGYLPEAERLLHGHLSTLDGFKGPGYQIAVAAFGLVFRDLFLAAKLVAVLSAGVVIVVLYRLIEPRLGRSVAWITVLIVATNAQFALYTIQIGTDLYFLALAVCAGAALLGTRTPKMALAAGILTGFAYLTRYNGLFLILAGLIILAFADRPRIELRARLKRAAIFFAACAVVIVPWCLFTWSRGKGFFYNVNYLNIAYELYGRGLVSWDQFWEYFNPAFHSFGEVIGASPSRFLFMVVTNGFEHVWLDMTQVMSSGEGPSATVEALAWGLFVLAGVILAARKYRWSAWPAMLLGLFTYGVLIPVFYGARFSLPMVPVYAVLVAIAALEITRMAKASFLARVAPGLVCGILLAAATVTTARSVSSLLATSPDEIRLIADVAKDHVVKGERVLARKPHIAWFLGLHYVRIPIIKSIDDLPRIAREEHARYLFVSGIEAALRRPLIPLLDPRNAPPFLRPIAATSGQPAVLYEFTIDIPPPATQGVLPAPKPMDLPQAVRLGKAYAAAGQISLALEQFRKALASNPDEPSARLALIQLEEARDESVAASKQATDADRQAANADLDRVEAEMRALAAAAPRSQDVQLGLAEFLVRRGRREDALAAYRRAFALDTLDAGTIARIGDLNRNLGHFDDAAQAYRRLTALAPKNQNAWRALGASLLDEHKPEEAVPCIRTALSLDTTSVPVRALLARALTAQGDTLKARTLWLRVLEATTEGAPLNIEARRALGMPDTDDAAP